MHSSFENQFRNCFPEMIRSIKSEALVPLLRLFLEELQAKGFTFEEVLFAFQTISEERGLKEVSSSLEEILSKFKKEDLNGYGGNNKLQKITMHQTFQNQFKACFPEMIVALKSEALVPLLKLFLEELEEKGFTFEEVLFAFQTISDERNLKEISSALERILSRSEKENVDEP